MPLGLILSAFVLAATVFSPASWDQTLVSCGTLAMGVYVVISAFKERSTTETARAIVLPLLFSVIWLPIALTSLIPADIWVPWFIG